MCRFKVKNGRVYAETPFIVPLTRNLENGRKIFAPKKDFFESINPYRIGASSFLLYFSDRHYIGHRFCQNLCRTFPTSNGGVFFFVTQTFTPLGETTLGVGPSTPSRFGTNSWRPHLRRCFAQTPPYLLWYEYVHRHARVNTGLNLRMLPTFSRSILSL